MPAGRPHDHLRKPARSGADTSKSSDVVRHGGKVDPDALLKRIQAAQPPPPPPPPAPAAGPGDADAEPTEIINTGDPDQVHPGSGEDDAPNRVVFVLQRDLDKRLDRYLCDRITFMSRTQLQGLIEEGGVTVNGRPPKASTKLRAGDRVEVYVPPPPPTEVVPQDITLEIMFEDEHLVVINKRPDIIVHPARTDKSGTMINALAFHFANRSGGALSGVGREFARPGVVHRLDRHTSGCIVFAKTDEAHWKIGQQFERRTVDKRYLAIVHGPFEPAIDPIDLPVGPHPSREKGYREKYVVRHDSFGKTALTIARVRRTFIPDRAARAAAFEPAPPAGLAPASAGWKAPVVANPEPPRPRPLHAGPTDVARGFSLVELELKTGRTHQIRVHLSHRGYPIAGDDMYGGVALYAGADAPVTADAGRAARDAAGGPAVLMGRQALHAATLRFRHPMTGQPLAFAAPLPDDMARMLAALGGLDPASETSTPPGATIPL